MKCGLFQGAGLSARRIFYGTMKLMEREFTAVIQKRGRWYVAWVEEVPGVNTQGRTLAEVRRNLKEALRDILEINREFAAKSRTGSERREPIAVEV